MLPLQGYFPKFGIRDLAITIQRGRGEEEKWNDVALAPPGVSLPFTFTRVGCFQFFRLLPKRGIWCGS